LGEAFYQTFKEYYDVTATDIDLNEQWLSSLDVRDYDAFKSAAEQINPDYIFNLAALTDLEQCEINSEETYLTNTVGAENGARISESLGSAHIYISTAGIFDGSKKSYDEDDKPAPMSVYGKSKYEGELAVQNSCSKYFIFRAGWMMGGGKKDKKFVYKILKQLIAGKKKLHVVNDLKGSPTYTFDFASNALSLISKNLFGLYNMTCEGGPSRYEVAEEMLNILGLHDDINLIEVDSDYFIDEYFAPRPDSEVLDNLRLKEINLNEMSSWKTGLRSYLERDWAHLFKK